MRTIFSPCQRAARNGVHGASVPARPRAGALCASLTLAAWANIEEMADDQGEAAEIRCEPRPEVLPGHLWIGVDDGEE